MIMGLKIKSIIKRGRQQTLDCLELWSLYKAKHMADSFFFQG
jgi:hypothetical protein